MIFSQLFLAHDNRKNCRKAFLSWNNEMSVCFVCLLWFNINCSLSGRFIYFPNQAGLSHLRKCDVIKDVINRFGCNLVTIGPRICWFIVMCSSTSKKIRNIQQLWPLKLTATHYNILKWLGVKCYSGCRIKCWSLYWVISHTHTSVAWHWQSQSLSSHIRKINAWIHSIVRNLK